MFQARLQHEQKASPPPVPFPWKIGDRLQPESPGTFEEYLTKLNALTIAQKELEALGQSLYRLAFRDPVGERFRTWYDDRARGERFRLRIDIDAHELDALPWELLWDGTGFLARSDVSIVRFSERARKQDIVLAPPLRALVVSAAPRGLEFDEESYVAPVRAAMQRSNIQVTSLTGPATTYSALHSALVNGNWDLFHFVGHGKFRDNAGKLILAHPETGREELDSSDLAHWLATANVRFAFLCSCKTGMVGSTYPFRGMAQALINRGTPAVVAMQFAFPQDDARVFVDAFYRELLAGKPIDEAIAYARSDLNYERVAWCIPALYSQYETAQLEVAKAAVAQIAPGTAPVPQVPLPNSAALRAGIDSVNSAWEKIDCYKDIHSALHNLEMVSCASISVLVKERTAAPTDPWSSRESRAWMGALQEMSEGVDRIVDAAAREFVAPSQKSWIARDLLPAQITLREAYQEANLQKVDDGLYEFSRIFSQQPVRFNDSIAESAQELRVAVTTLQKHAEGAPPDLARNLRALSDIEDALMLLMQDHGQWQEVVGIIRLAELTAPVAPNAMNREWNKIDRLLTPLLGDSQEFWSINLRDTRARFIDASSGKTQSDEQPIAIFMDVCRQAKIRFFGVDEKLKGKAKELDRLLETIRSQF